MWNTFVIIKCCFACIILCFYCKFILIVIFLRFTKCNANQVLYNLFHWNGKLCKQGSPFLFWYISLSNFIHPKVETKTELISFRYTFFHERCITDKNPLGNDDAILWKKKSINQIIFLLIFSPSSSLYISISFYFAFWCFFVVYFWCFF